MESYLQKKLRERDDTVLDDQRRIKHQVQAKAKEGFVVANTAHSIMLQAQEKYDNISVALKEVHAKLEELHPDIVQYKQLLQEAVTTMQSVAEFIKGIDYNFAGFDSQEVASLAQKVQQLSDSALQAVIAVSEGLEQLSAAMGSESESRNV